MNAFLKFATDYFGGPMKVVIRSNDDDWYQLEVGGGGWPDPPPQGYCGHSVPKFIWIELLRAAGVEVTEVFDNFGEEEVPE